MVGKFEVIGERENTFETKRGTVVVQKILACLDTEIPTLLNTVDYVLNPDEEKYFGSLNRQPVKIAIEDIKVDFGGRLQMKGKLIAE